MEIHWNENAMQYILAKCHIRTRTHTYTPLRLCRRRWRCHWNSSLFYRFANEIANEYINHADHINIFIQSIFCHEQCARKDNEYSYENKLKKNRHFGIVTLSLRITDTTIRGHPKVMGNQNAMRMPSMKLLFVVSVDFQHIISSLFETNNIYSKCIHVDIILLRIHFIFVQTISMENHLNRTSHTPHSAQQ